MPKKAEKEEKMTIEKEGEQEAVEEQVEQKKPRAKIVITDEAFVEALEKAGGEAKITPLYEAFDKTDYPDVALAKLKTALRTKGKKLAEADKVQAVHVDGKRTYTFKTA